MRLWLTVLLILPVLLVNAQFQLSVFCGLSDYNGDLLDKPYRISKPAFGASIGYQYADHLTLRLSATAGKIEGADSLNDWRNFSKRNLSFQSRISELALTLEYDLRSGDQIFWTPFAYTGLAIYRYNPYTYDQNGNKVYLQPLSTEGQGLTQYPRRKPYALTRLAVPVGGGLKFFLSNQFLLTAQIGLRVTNNDYLDDVSTSYVDEAALLEARGPVAVELSFRERTRRNNRVYPKAGTSRGRSGKLIYTDFYYFSGFNLIYRFANLADEAFSGRAWNNRRLRCARF